jgi:hypothetical protein
MLKHLAAMCEAVCGITCGKPAGRWNIFRFHWNGIRSGQSGLPFFAADQHQAIGDA